MIPKIRRGQRITGLMTYLLGEGDHNEHRDRHIVTGSPTVMRAAWLAHFDGPGDRAAAREVALAVAHEIDIPRQLYGTQVRMRARAKVGAGVRDLGLDVIERPESGEQGVMRDAPVWHAVLSLAPGEQLDDETWARLAQDFMSRMGFNGSDDGTGAPARWAAVRHGHSGERGDGQDHVHIAASLVREDGSKVSTFDYGPGRAKGDWKRAQQVCGELEHEYGLQVLLSREVDAGTSGNSRAEIERQRRTGAPETEREGLRRRVRAAAVVAESEAEWLRLMRAEGITVIPRWAPGGTDEVQGYSVRPAGSGADKPATYSGTRLGKDMTLPNLRRWAPWDASLQARADALAEWRRASGGKDATTRPGGLRVVTEREMLDQLAQFGRDMRAIPIDDHDGWAQAASVSAGVFAAASVRTEPKPGPLDRLARELARAGQLPAHRRRPRPARDNAPRTVARAFWAATHPGGANVALAVALVDLLLATRDCLDAAGRGQHAAKMASEARRALTEIHMRAAGVDPGTNYDRTPGSPAWAAAFRASGVVDQLDKAWVERQIRTEQAVAAGRPDPGRHKPITPPAPQRPYPGYQPPMPGTDRDRGHGR